MQWDASRERAASRAGEPWLPLDPDCATRHVEALSQDPTSILTLYRRLIDLRRRSGR